MTAATATAASAGPAGAGEPAIDEVHAEIGLELELPSWTVARAEALLDAARRPVPQIPDGRVEVAGAFYMPDARGRLTPLELVRAQDLLQDEMVRRILGHALALSAQIARFRAHCADDIAAFDSLLEGEYGGHARRSVKGNRTYVTLDGTARVSVQIAEQVTFGPELQVARDLVDECLDEWAKDSRDEIRAIVSHAFQADAEGQISRSAIYSLLRLDIDDPRWRRAMEAVRDAMRVTGSKSYIRAYRRARPDAEWEPVSIDMAKAGGAAS